MVGFFILQAPLHESLGLPVSTKHSCPSTELLSRRTAGTSQRTDSNRCLQSCLHLQSSRGHSPSGCALYTSRLFCQIQHSHVFICQNNMTYAMELYARDSKDIRYKCEPRSCKTGFNLIAGGSHTVLSTAVHASQRLTGPPCCAFLLTNICISSI